MFYVLLGAAFYSSLTTSLPLHHRGSGLCLDCYSAFEKECRTCRGAIELGQLHWGTGLCGTCYANKRNWNRELALGLTRGPSDVAQNEAIAADVRMLISTQLVFYLAPAVMLPSLFLHIQHSSWGAERANAVYAAVLTTTTVVAMVAPVPLGLWAERRGEREVYSGVTLLATLAAVNRSIYLSIYMYEYIYIYIYSESRFEDREAGGNNQTLCEIMCICLCLICSLTQLNFRVSYFDLCWLLSM